MKKALTIVFTLAAVTTSLFILAKLSYGVPLRPSLAPTYLGQYAGLIGATFLCITFVFTTRLQIIDRLFGGQDKVYRIHRVVSLTGFFAILAHPALFAMRGAAIGISPTLYLLPGADLTLNAGIFGLYTLITLVALTLLVKLPYHIWKFTHSFMGLFLFFAFYHILTIPSDISVYMPLRAWMVFLFIVASTSYLYTILFSRVLRPKYFYIVDRIVDLGNVTEIYLVPESKNLEFEPGQFLFVRFPRSAVGGEEHPFTISSPQGAKELRISAKKDGDYTNELPSLKKGDRAAITAPYGGVYRGFARGNDVVCIAGGIGITPFLSLFGSSSIQSIDRKKHLFYSVPERNQAHYDKELQEDAKKDPNLDYNLWVTADKGYLTVEKIREVVGSLKDKKFYICGPSTMYKAISSQLRALGIGDSQVMFEEFNFR